MITFPNAKINIGLDVLNKREDGYHNIDSLFYPLPLKDALEIIPTGGDLEFTSSGISLSCHGDDNLVVKAFRLLQSAYHLPNVKIHLHKNIPFGAGLGGGSADAAFALMMVNDMFELQISEDELIAYASKIGADCAFFIKNCPCMARGIGDELIEYPLDLKGKYIVLVKPDVAVPTADAYRYIKPGVPELSLQECLAQPIEKWKHTVKNDFEISVFKQHPLLANIKDDLYKMGAQYVSMSGSGSSIFSIFDKKIDIPSHMEEYFSFSYQL